MINRDTLKAVHERMSHELALGEADAASARANGKGAEGERNALHTGQLAGGGNDSLELRYNIGRDQAHKVFLPAFLKGPKVTSDPAYKVSTRQLPLNHALTTKWQLRASCIACYATYSPVTSARSSSAMNLSMEPRNLRA